MAGSESTLLEQAAAPTWERIDHDREAAANVWVERILNCVRSSVFRPGFNVDELRADLGLRDNTVPEHFRTALGVNLRTYIEECRLETSCRLLLATDLLVERVARLVGYEIPATFNRAFHRRVGCSPTAYRTSGGTAGRRPGPGQRSGAREMDEQPQFKLPRLLVGIGTLSQGYYCHRCGEPMSAGTGVRLFEDLRPICELCAYEHGPRELRPFYRVAMAEADAKVAGELDDEVGKQPQGRDRDPDDGQLAVLLTAAKWLEAADDERTRAAAVWYAIKDLPHAEPEERIRELEPPFLTDALFVRVQRESQALIHDQPQRSRELAELALTAVETIDPMLLGAGRGPYVECDAWAWLANARRTACDLRGAHEALKKAYASYDQGIQKTLRMAKLLDYEGSLRRDQDRFDEALACLDRALDIYRDARAEPHLTAKILIQKGTVYGRACRPDRAVPVLRQAVALLDPQLHRPLLLSGYQILATCLCENERHEEAAKLLPLVDELASESDQGMDRARVEWLRARVETGTGKEESAIRRLKATQQLFLDLASPYDAAVVGLDLATIYVETGRRKEMLALARTMAPILQSGDLHREAVTALTILNRALKNNDLPADLIRRLRTYLKQARFNRDLRFEDVT